MTRIALALGLVAFLAAGCSGTPTHDPGAYGGPSRLPGHSRTGYSDVGASGRVHFGDGRARWGFGGPSGRGFTGSVGGRGFSFGGGGFSGGFR